MGGPFAANPFKDLPSRVSPLGVATHKYSGKKRLILDLSAPHDGVINSLIDKDRFSLKYVSIDHAISIIKTLGQGALLSKFDIKSAFKLLPICPDLHRFHCVLWKGLYYYFVRLAFGSRSSPALSEAIHHIATTHYGIHNLLFLLDDVLCLVPPGGNPLEQKQALLSMFDSLGIPLIDSKLRVLHVV